MIVSNWYEFAAFVGFYSWSMILYIIAQFICGNGVQNLKQKISAYQTVPLLALSYSLLQLWLYSSYFPAYFTLFSACIVTIYTDFFCMLISRFVSLYLAPTGILFAYFELLPISWHESLAASIIGYAAFCLINSIFYFFKKQDGLGQGDLDLMALIGAYTGLLGCWLTVLYGSLLATLSVIAYMIYHRKYQSKIPFGPFLCIGSMLFVLCQTAILQALCWC